MADRNDNVTTFHFSGPAIKEIWLVTVLQWGFALVFPFWVSHVSSCPETWHPFAHYPMYVWIPFWFVVGLSLYKEARCLLWVIYTQALYCSPFRIFNKRVTFEAWLAIMLLLGLTAHADIATNGLFMAKILKTVKCDREPMRTIQDMWAFVWKESIVSWIPGFGRIELLLAACWAIMFVQPIIGVLSACPIKGAHRTNYERGVGPDDPVQGEMDGYVTPCSWLQQCAGSDKMVHHADVLKWLAVVNRMVSITDRTLLWTLKRGHQKLDQARAETGMKKEKGILGVYDMLSREFAFNLYRLTVVNFLEKIFMLEAQTTMFAISRCMMPRTLALRFDPQMLMSVALSFLTFTKTVWDAKDQLINICRFWTQIAQEDNSKMSLLPWTMMCCCSFWQLEWHHARYGIEENEDLAMLETVRKRRRMYLLLFGFVLTTTFLCIGLAHSAIKFTMAFVCPHSLWNIPSIYSQQKHMDWKGCVDLSQFLGFE